jgi:cytoskeleton protein RodZ
MDGMTEMLSVADEPGRGTMERSVNVGADLRLARERLGWELPSVAAKLRIRLPYLQALESGDLSTLPGNAYAIGFLRTYSTALGLDPDEMSRRFRAETTDLNRQTKLVFPAPVPERGVPALAVVLVGLVLIIGAYAGWYRMSGDNVRHDDVTPPLPTRLAPLSAGLAPLPAITPQAPASPPVPQPVTTPTPTPMPPPLVAAIPVPTPVPVTMPGATPLAPVPASSGSLAAETGQSLAALGPDGGRLAVRATQEAWIQVKDRVSGSVVTDRVLQRGEVWQVPNRSGLILTVGNAGGTQVLLDGQPSPSLGTEGAVRRGLPLEVDQVRDGKLAANYTAPSGGTAPTTRPATQN